MGDRICRACAILLIAVAAFLLVDDFIMIATASPKFSIWQLFLDLSVLTIAMLSV